MSPPTYLQLMTEVILIILIKFLRKIFSRYVCIPCPVCDHLNMSGPHCHSLHNLQIQVVSPKLHSDFRPCSSFKVKIKCGIKLDQIDKFRLFVYIVSRLDV